MLAVFERGRVYAQSTEQSEFRMHKMGLNGSQDLRVFDDPLKLVSTCYAHFWI